MSCIYLYIMCILDPGDPVSQILDLFEGSEIKSKEGHTLEAISV